MKIEVNDLFNLRDNMMIINNTGIQDTKIQDTEIHDMEIQNTEIQKNLMKCL